MINNAGSVDNTQDSSYQCGHFDIAHSESLKENAAKTDPAALITAYPLAEALREMLKASKRKDEFPIATRHFTASEMGIFQHTEEHYNRSINRAIKALTQAETLIKQSEAVWAVVEAGKDYAKNQCFSKRKCLIDMVRRLEALEMMEGGE